MYTKAMHHHRDGHNPIESLTGRDGESSPYFHDHFFGRLNDTVVGMGASADGDAEVEGGDRVGLGTDQNRYTGSLLRGYQWYLRSNPGILPIVQIGNSAGRFSTPSQS